ncbi:hypothetical protein Pmar_PMAR004329 [Perkinsus marinus ATCC 50983]|uniref:Uncharacterized protein n=1 Tax=Perkinsus marinus (strain ATCC 50983 / TXsc) TaxID=423536 RepID=C5K4H2_PERM5|nr:hypothetical protein Pmar_PMAR007635 [Perkinsus marinus ATCC 50983]XP_002772876.1 hypothetical protein Pmar_PMAR016002 [Perkinsus marinus ATCC 50983]XP_002788869.1 hypothetical protein Pmar_PMAR004329 [Perkinsus marinus ATCC 50983]EER01942.1 hypothetical protein Pmar_PMAR007635 [Perkinsus marinus ATCC 50983]EER04692.1 hypothetical protein Pmar_PMAR016002 [Perkinsus marinus ATCC 50983]EER20665.1 hypothetical protein Pmar_PMAR004329 [Perkinsus marinus ATCC 50983]|eukprot:XP_002769224.1 hypothetical protein Pmar_PMAR007635 [Perkinsus marinus ATCC 50983]
MKFIAAVASAVVAVSLTGCSSDDSTTTSAPATTVAPTTGFLQPTTSAPTGSVTCQAPTGKYCGSFMGQSADVTINNGKFSMNLAGQMSCDDVPFTMSSDCSALVLDSTNPSYEAMAKSAQMETSMLSQMMLCDYNSTSNVFTLDVTQICGHSLDMTPDQCSN